MKLNKNDDKIINDLTSEISRMFDRKNYGVSDDVAIKHALKKAYEMVDTLKEIKKEVLNNSYEYDIK